MSAAEPPPPSTTPFRGEARAKFEGRAYGYEYVSLRQGDTVDVQAVEGDWAYGFVLGSGPGWFPRDYVKPVEPSVGADVFVEEAALDDVSAPRGAHAAPDERPAPDEPAEPDSAAASRQGQRPEPDELAEPVSAAASRQGPRTETDERPAQDCARFHAAVAALRKVVGDWVDQGHSHYSVTLDPGYGLLAFTCSVRTTRPDGKVKDTQRLIRACDDGTVRFGIKHQLLDDDGKFRIGLVDDDTLVWKPRGLGSNFIWKRVPRAGAFEAPAHWERIGNWDGL